jgi:hypothetical protein
LPQAEAHVFLFFLFFFFRENRRGEPLLPKFIRKNSKSARYKLQAGKKETGVEEETGKTQGKQKKPKEQKKPEVRE